MDAALVYTYGTPKPGSFKQYLELIKQTQELFETLRQEGKISSYEFFAFETGDADVSSGLTILKGPAESIRGLDTDPRFIALTWRTVLTVSHFTTQLALFGERLTEVVAANVKTMQELDLVPIA